MPIHRNYILAVATILAAILFSLPSYAATTLLPNGKQCFTDANGVIISGSLNMFVPATTTPKPTWQDSGQVTLNSQPIQLDANGCAVIYGIGQYRQQLFDGPVVGGVTTGNLIWDQLTTDTSAFNSTFWAGIAGGTPNVITIVDTGFNATDGTVVNFTALASNTGPTTINPSGFGAISVEKDTTSGPVSLSGGEIVQNNVISVIYRASDNAFHIVNPPIQTAAGGTEPLCGITNLKIVNDVGAPTTTVDITADQALTQSVAGLVLNRTNVSVTLNISLGTVTSTAGGMDGETAPVSGWIDVWLIDNGSAINALGSKHSGNGLTPVLPSGVTYKCRAGAVQVDGASALFRQQINGQFGHYVITAGGNTANYGTAPLNIASGGAGVFSLTTPTLVAATVVGDGFCGPATASQINVIANNDFNNQGATNLEVARSQAYSGANNGPGGTNKIAGYDLVLTVTTGATAAAWIPIEGTSVSWAGAAAGASILCGGWKDITNAP
jgi:hypothetical protein